MFASGLSRFTPFVSSKGRYGSGTISGGGGGAGSITVDPPEMNAPSVSGSNVTVNWVIPTQNSDGSTSPITIGSFEIYYTPDANPPTEARPGGTGAVAVTGISSSAVSQAINGLASGSYWIAMRTIGGPSNAAGNLSSPVYATV